MKGVRVSEQGTCSVLCNLRNHASASLHSPESHRTWGKLRALSKTNTSLPYFLFQFSFLPQQFPLNLDQEITFTFLCFPPHASAYTINIMLWVLQPSWILIFKTRFWTQKACFPCKNIPVTTDTEKLLIEVVNAVGLWRHILWASKVAQLWRIHLPSRRCRFDPLEKEMVTRCSILAWKIPWTEEPGRLQSMGSQRAGQDLTTKQQQDTHYRHMNTHTHSLSLYIYI